MDIETELKLALTQPAQLETLLAVLPAPWEVIDQANHYFVDPDRRLDVLRVAVRGREERTDGGEYRAVVTIKRRTGKAHGVFVADEQNFAVTAEELAAARAGTADLADVAAGDGALRDRLPVERLEYRGTLRNVRHRIRHAGFELEVDRTSFPDGSVDVEIEVETNRPEAARAVLMDVAASAGVALADQKRGKYNRFLRRTGAT